ncbi:methyltransferase [Fusarium bulbicola]|nr:methyltransferase [Fusarium bulbicola]
MTEPNESEPAQAATDVSGLLPPEHWAEVAEELGDADSALGDDNAESTASITSSILEYRNINGRTYHHDIGNAQYWGTNDEKQNESMDINHHVLTLVLAGALYLAPLSKDIKSALDIGTGTGKLESDKIVLASLALLVTNSTAIVHSWFTDFADSFPDTQVIGTDVSPIQPGWIPPNLRFDIEDCTQEWTFAPNSQDYIHFRWLVGSIVDWDQLFKEAYKCLEPGSFIESHEALSRMDCDDGSITEKSAMHQWGNFFVEGGKKIGRSFTIIEDGVQRSAMENAGFVNLEERDFKVPIGGWAKDSKMKEIGKYAQATLEQDIEGYVLFMANTVEGWTKAEVEVYISMLRRELRKGTMHPYYRQKVVWAQKPKE